MIMWNYTLSNIFGISNHNDQNLQIWVLTFWHTIQLFTTIHPFGDLMPCWQCPEVLQQCLQLSEWRFGQGRERNLLENIPMNQIVSGIVQVLDPCHRSSEFSWWCTYSIVSLVGMMIETDCALQETCKVHGVGLLCWQKMISSSQKVEFQCVSLMKWGPSSDLPNTLQSQKMLCSQLQPMHIHYFQVSGWKCSVTTNNITKPSTRQQIGRSWMVISFSAGRRRMSPARLGGPVLDSANEKMVSGWCLGLQSCFQISYQEFLRVFRWFVFLSEIWGSQAAVLALTFKNCCHAHGSLAFGGVYVIPRWSQVSFPTTFKD